MAYIFTKWAENEDGWDTDTGNPGIMLVANAIQAWSVFQERPTTIHEAAKVFNLGVNDVRSAIAAHPWMMVGSDPLETIEHDGE